MLGLFQGAFGLLQQIDGSLRIARRSGGGEGGGRAQNHAINVDRLEKVFATCGGDRFGGCSLCSGT